MAPQMPFPVSEEDTEAVTEVVVVTLARLMRVILFICQHGSLLQGGITWG